MEINYTKEETLQLIEEYYKRLEGREVKAKITSTKGGIDMYDHEGCITTISITEKMDVCGMKKDVVTRLTTDEFRNHLRALFGLYEFNLTTVTLNDGLNSRWEGYGYCEHEVKNPYFKGITVNVEKQKNKGLKKAVEG